MNSGNEDFGPFIKGHNKVGVDSNLLIYLIEDHRRYGEQASNIFTLIEKYRNEFWTSVITIPEILTKPIRQRRFDMANRYEQELRQFFFAEIKESTARFATQLGATYSLKTKDALIVASLIEVGVAGFITADKDFERVKEIDVLLIG